MTKATDPLTRGRALLRAAIEESVEAAGSFRDADWGRMVDVVARAISGDEHAAPARLGGDRVVAEIHQMLLAARDGPEMKTTE
jgi:hypothetical protein